jgi:excinuclease UvrABC nuclease subunit
MGDDLPRTSARKRRDGNRYFGPCIGQQRRRDHEPRRRLFPFGPAPSTSEGRRAQQPSSTSSAGVHAEAISGEAFGATPTGSPLLEGRRATVARALRADMEAASARQTRAGRGLRDKVRAIERTMSQKMAADATTEQDVLARRSCRGGGAAVRGP